MPQLAPVSSRPDNAGSLPIRRLGPVLGVSINGVSASKLGLTKFITGGIIDLDINKISFCELFVDNLNSQMMDDTVWQEKQTMGLFLGYGGDPDSCKFHGSYSMARPRFELTGRRRITIQGFGDGIQMTTHEQRRVFEGMTYTEIVQKVNKSYGLNENINITMKDKIPSLTQAGVNDYEFLKEIARRAGVDFFLFGGGLYFIPFAANPEGGVNQIDAAGGGVLSLVFSIDGDGPAVIEASTPINPMTGEYINVHSEFFADGLIDVEDNKNQVRFPGLAAVRTIYVDAKGNLLTEQAVKYMLSSDANHKKLIVRVNATIEGLPNMRPRQFVAFTNVGQRFAVPFYITKVRHQVNGSIFQTSFEAVRATTNPYTNDRTNTGNDTIGGTPTPQRDVSAMSKAGD
jgi:hypothetical protein